MTNGSCLTHHQTVISAGHSTSPTDRATGFSRNPYKPGMAHVYNPSTQEARTETRRGYIKRLSQKKKEIKKSLIFTLQDPPRLLLYVLELLSSLQVHFNKGLRREHPGTGRSAPCELKFSEEAAL
jgi:hypothetical protein